MTKERKVKSLSNLAEGCDLDPCKKESGIAGNRERKFVLGVY